MADVLTVEDIKRVGRLSGVRPIEGDKYACFVDPYFYKELRVATDPFLIYRQRRLLAKVMPSVAVYRGDEWWHG